MKIVKASSVLSIKTPEISIDLASFHGWQKEAILARDPYVLVAAGYGSGKTTVGAVKTVANVLEGVGWPHLIIGPTWTTLKSVQLRKLKSIFLASGFERSYVDDLLYVHQPMDEKYLDWGNGTHVFLRSAKNPGSIEGLEVATEWIDEARLINAEAYRIAATRCRLKRAPLIQRFLTSTPAMNWLATQYDTGRPFHRLIQGSTISNLANLDTNYVKGLEASFSKRVLRAILYGDFVPLDGGVYDTFDPKLPAYVYDNYNKRLERHRKTHLWIDPAQRRAAVVWVRETDDPLHWVVFRQEMPTNQSMADTILQINKINEKENIAIDAVWCDPAADQKDQANMISVAQLLQKIKRRNIGGISWITAPFTGIAWGVERVRALLGDPEEDGLKPRLRFTRELIDLERRKPQYYDNRGVIKSLQAYQYPEHKEGRPYTEIPLKDGIHDHVCDAIRYGAAGLWLTTGLRQIHPVLAQDKSVGYVCA